jgi:hypothetical protein
MSKRTVAVAAATIMTAGAIIGTAVAASASQAFPLRSPADHPGLPL